MSELVKYSRQGEVFVITIDNPPVNALSPGVPEGIVEGIDRAAADPEVKGVVIIGGGRTFIAGADIREFGKMVASGKRSVALLPTLLKIEDSAKPVVMAIHGTAFGGGLETAMAGHYRVAVAAAQVGQPEVKLGLIPGAAGTQRLPRLCGVELATEMCALGDPVKAPKALAAGILDRIVEGDLLEGAVAFCGEKIAAGGPYPKTRERNDKLGGVDTAFFAGWRERCRKERRGLMAPLAAVDAVEAAINSDFARGCEIEAELFRTCLFSDQSRSLIHAFFGEREVAKVPGIGKDTRTYDIRAAGVIGAGTMGGGIAMVYANAGIPVRLRETTQEALDRGMNTIRKNYQNSVNKGRFPQEVMDKRMALITPQLDYAGFDQVDIVVEAVFEGMALKKEIFAELDRMCKPGCILASNTSTLDIDEIASATSRPEFVIGHHFFSPANVMRLLEIVRGKHTSLEVIATSMNLSKTLSKVGVLAGNCRGFIGNRMVAPYGREAQFLVEEGASPEQVDQVLYAFGLAMGPLAMSDLAGIDVGWRIRQEFKHTEIPGRRYPFLADVLYEMGRYGQKTGAGWYQYDANRRPVPDAAVAEMIERETAKRGIQRKAISNEEIIERTQYALVNEGARILEEGIALRAVDIDIIYIMGYGYPAHRGGPMWYADTVGLQKVYDRICEFEKEHGAWWAPAPLLKQLAAEGKTFAQWDKDKAQTAAA
jgi:3-hydroxyacyl-CoA dehydrogenase